MDIYKEYENAIIEKIPRERVYTDYLSRYAYGTDASCYRYIPKMVIKAFTKEEVQYILAMATKMQIPLTFKATGSSLSGQTCSNSILVMVAQGWDGIDISLDTQSVSIQPGVIGMEANKALAPFKKKIGPDPATISIARIGGIVSNNSSGMCCGVKQNSYNTIKSATLILSDGTVVNTADATSMKEFKEHKAELVQELLAIKKEIMADKALFQTIQKKFSIKNTTGYSINTFVDYETIEDILTHIVVGSEGTLAFIANVVYETVDNKDDKASALLFYQDVYTATKAIERLVKLGDVVTSAELMDYLSLKTVANVDGMPKELQQIQEGTSCVLLQTEADSTKALEKNITLITDTIKDIPTVFPVYFASDTPTQDLWWKIRKGLFPIASAQRKAGSTVIIEDVCFYIHDLADGIVFLQELFKKYGFDNGFIFGHALSGNVHFVVTPDLSDAQELRNFEALLDEMSHKIASMGGSIKAEHGTGRMVAPYVELEWGNKAYELMKRIKKAFDPKGILNPDVIFSSNPKIHMQNLKEMPLTEYELINQCIECGFCETVCPSKNITLTPRQRITVQREIARLKQTNPRSQELQELEKMYEYKGDETCADCNMCSTTCPLGIPTGVIAESLREKKSPNMIATWVQKHFSFVSSSMRFGLSIATFAQSLLGHKILTKITAGLRSCYMRFIPLVRKYFPQRNTYALHSTSSSQGKKVIYFTTCLNRILAPSTLMADTRSIQEVFTSLCTKADIAIIYPQNIQSLCCGKTLQAFSEEHKAMQDALYNALLEISNNGSIPIVIDHTSCTAHILDSFTDTKLQIMDIHSYVLQEIIPTVHITKIDEPIGLFTMCAGKKRGFNITMKELAHLCTNGEIIEPNIPCCGFAGYKGFLTPELNISATASIPNIFASSSVTKGYSCSSTCEIGLSNAGNFSWQNIIYLVDNVATKK